MVFLIHEFVVNTFDLILRSEVGEVVEVKKPA